jgi:predicted ATP-grasp superfamily ATP-dependent carboligase
MNPGVPGRVLVTDGEFKHALGIARALFACGHEVHVVVRDRRAPAAHSRAVRAAHPLPRTTDPRYAEALLALATQLAPVSLVAVGDGAVRAADRLRGRWPEGVRVALPPRTSLEIANDKARTGELARRVGVHTPREGVPTSEAEAIDLWESFGGCVVVKSRLEAGRKVLRYARTASEVRRAFAWVREESGTDPLVQEYVTGEGWAYFALYWNGQEVRRFMHRRVREWPPSGGTSACAESVLDAPDLERAGRALLDALAWHGVAMVEGKRGPNGQFTLMEINAKFWGSHDLALAAGVDFPGDLVELLEGGTLSAQAPYRKVRFAWPLGGDLWHALAVPAHAPAVAGDLLSPAVAKSFRWSDPAPTFWELLQWARSTPGALREWRNLR